jgi:predicted nucleotidyltransferase component of viral defense system
MFNYTKHEIESLSRETGFIKNSIEKMLRLLDVLHQISRHPFLKNCFVLKGGTALNVFYFDLPRLSIDADMNYIKEINSDRMKKDQEEIDELIPYLFSEEYHVSKGKMEYALSQFELRYSTLSGSKDLIKLEINYLHRLPLTPTSLKVFNQYGLNVNFPLLGVEELIASKIITFLSRYTPRDLFDLYYVAAGNVRMNQALVQDLVYYFGIISRASIFELFQNKTGTITEHSIRAHLYPMLAKINFPSLNIMRDAVIDFMQPFLHLDAEQENAIKNFYNSGDLRTSSLFKDKGIREKVIDSPAYQWKSRNIKRIK